MQVFKVSLYYPMLFLLFLESYERTRKEVAIEIEITEYILNIYRHSL